jgi:hypothetical protein
MKSLSLIAPPDAGAARIKVIGPDGPLELTRSGEGAPIVTPSEPELRILDAANGAYTAIIEPLGGEAFNYLFVVDDQTREVRVPSLGQLADVQVPEAWVRSGRSRPEPHAETFYRRDEELLDLPSPARDTGYGVEGKCLSIGLSTDARPMRYGGWRPFAGTWPISIQPLTRSSEAPTSGDWQEGVAVDIVRGSQPLSRTGGAPRGKDEARLRFTIAIEATRVQRLLVPLYWGGTRIRMIHIDPDDVALEVVPLESDRLSLIQALVSGFDGEALAIWKDFQKSHPIHAYISADLPEDPWIVVVAGLLTLRFDSLSYDCPGWVDELTHRYPWIPDVHVLKARYTLLSAGEPGQSLVEAADVALDSLYRARSLGAPFFTSANDLLGESLLALADGAPEDRQRIRAADEIVRWRKHLPHQRTAGASFSWVMTNGHRSGGWLDSRYFAILGAGAVSERGLRLSPV